MSNTVKLTELRIGRNYNNNPCVVEGDGTTMSDQAWDRFKADAREALEVFAFYIKADSYWTETHTGIGTWTDKDGVEHTEESAVVTLYWTEHGLNLPSVTRFSYKRLYNRAATLALVFNQDAVAVIRDGRSILVGKDGIINS